jgi:hypothetical protein
VGDTGGQDELDRELARMIDDGAEKPARPSRESLREVKREARAREKEKQEREKSAKDYWAAQSDPGRTGRAGSAGRWIAVLVTILVVGGGALYLTRSGIPGVTSPAANPTGAPDASDGAQAEEAVPFAGTPAESWKVGAKGITLPEAKQVGLYTPDQVEAAYRKTRTYLKAAMLDRRVLFKGKLQPVLVTMTPGSRARLTKAVQKGKEHPDAKDATTWVNAANRFHPNDWRAEGETRVRGRMKARVADDGGLLVKYAYAVAYWMRPTSGGSWAPIVIRREGEAYFSAVGSGISGLWSGRDGVTSLKSVCGSQWPYPQYLQVWPDPESVVTPSRGVYPGWDPSDPETVAVPEDDCFTDTSGF